MSKTFLYNQNSLIDFVVKIILQKEIIRKFEEITGLDFVEEKMNGNLCFATNNSEMQDDFKLTFLPIDLLNYFNGTIQRNSSFRLTKNEIPYPADKDDFLEKVNIGKNRNYLD
ncbi:MAG: hypothetical protein GX102_04300 [Porphyromonadaceae bacterium]|jgi:hypothetical protein|nr:hypothetical protein [Porphyromonadaceae bacterium]